MELVRWPGEEPTARRRSAATLGVFDGVHRGHAEVIRRLVAAARAGGWRAAVVTFDRHPDAVVAGRSEPAITSLQHRLRLFGGLGVDLCVVIEFSDEVASTDAGDFLRAVMRDLLDVRLLVVGEDCRFGRGRRGDVALCRRLGPELGFEVEAVPPVAVAGERVSSTAIRRAVVAGDLERAERLLGRPLSLYGTVVRGDGRGRAIGFPTANLDLHNEVVPPDGVYAGWAFLDGSPLPCVISIGRRETFHAEPQADRVAEVHILDFAEDLYGCDIEVRFAERLREQKSFSGSQALAAQIGRDVRAARRTLARGPGPA
jgi:riboflavin kinase/FMN adenylyltransferase